MSDNVLDNYLKEYSNKTLRTFMNILISTSFMKRGTSQDMKLGHKMQPVIMTNPFTKKHLSDRELLSVYQTGLIQNCTHLHIHANPDYVELARIDDEIQPIFVEIKCWTRMNTALTEERLISPAN